MVTGDPERKEQLSSLFNKQEGFGKKPKTIETPANH